MSRLLQHLAAEHAVSNPHATAVVLRKDRLTYGELEEQSNRLARALIATGCERGDRVCFLMPKSPVALVAMLGILKADCVYVPLDPAGPTPRLSRIVKRCEPRAILAAGPVSKMLDEMLPLTDSASPISFGWMSPELPADCHVEFELTLDGINQWASAPVASQNSDTDPAYILFTSGSTGTPKGVVITHRNVTGFIDWSTRYFGLRQDDRVSGHSPFHFDLSVFDIFGAFAAGAELHLVPPELNLSPAGMSDWIERSRLTQWFSVPSALNYMAKFDLIRPESFPELRRLLWCGEVLPVPTLRYLMQRLPHVSFTNLYGPTEATIASSYYTVPGCPADDRVEIPIGTPCDGEDLLVLDDELRPVPAGELGNLYIGGVGLARGYWRDPEKTAAAFVRNPWGTDADDRLYRTGDLASVGPDNLVYFHGRADTQIKSRGYRIELGEIESALNAFEFLQEGAIVAIATDGFEGMTICCAYCPAPIAQPVTPVMLRKALGRVLPSYMLPSRWLALDQLPKNTSGKIDRPRLRQQFEALRAETAAAAMGTEH